MIEISSDHSCYNKALLKVEEAKKILPNYFEVYRVGAFIKVMNSQYLSADEDYKIGIDIEPDNPNLLFYYAQFLLFHLGDAEGAVNIALRLIKLRPNNPHTHFLIARCYSSLFQYETAINTLIDLKLNDKNLSNKELKII